ncbi:MAG: retropepsin-like aspartic protease [Saprospiraceae bacterium]
MRILYFLFTIVFFLSSSSCNRTFFKESVQRGSVEQVSDLVPLQAIQKHGLLFIPVEIGGETYNFMLDTGAGVSAVDKQLADKLGLQKLRSAPVGNASNQRQQYDFIEINQLKISGLSFNNTLAIREDFSNFPIAIPNFGGIIGQPVISKVHWKIDFTTKKIKIAQRRFAYDLASAIPYEIGNNHLPYVPLQILGKTTYAVFDTGCSDMLNFPLDRPLSKELLNSYPVRINEVEVFTLGQERTIQVKTMLLPEVKLDDKVLFKKVSVLFDHISEPKLGAPFFKNRILIIDTEAKRIVID